MNVTKTSLALLFTLPVLLTARPGTPLTLTLATSPNPSIVGSPVTITATALSVFTPTGKVTFYDGPTVLGTRAMSGWQSKITTNLLGAGTHSLTAFYGGDQENSPATTPALSQVVNPVSGKGFETNLLPVGAGPINSLVGDFNGDGYSDIAVVNESDNSVSILLGTGSALFQTAVNYPVGSAPFGISAGDFNEDGFTDLIVSNAEGNNVSVLLGRGDGTFQAGVPCDTDSFPLGTVVGDFNHDGHADFAVANDFSGNISVFLGNGDGTFLPPSIYPTNDTEPFMVAVGDFNGDGKDDLVTASSHTGGLTVMIGSGDGTFLPGVSYATGDYSISIVIADFNQDGFSDIAVTTGETGVSVLLGRGDGTFNPPVSYPAGLLAVSVVSGDFDGDGHTDLAVASLDGGLTVLLGNADGTFQDAPPSSINGLSGLIAAGDFNGDGRTDIVVPLVNNEVAVLLRFGVATTTTLTAPDSVYGQPVVFTATVSPAFAPGTVTFQDGATVVAAVLLTEGTATFSSNSLPAGPHPLTATYNGTNLAYGRSTDSHLVQITGCSTVTQSTLYVDANGGPQSIHVAATSPSCTWLASTDSLWIQLSSTVGTGSGTLTATLAPNTTGSPLIGIISIGAQTIAVTQRATTPQPVDVQPSDFYFDAVNTLFTHHVTTGCTSSPLQYCPTQLIPRWEAAVFIVRAIFGGDNFTFSSTPFFNDVASGDPGFQWIQKLHELGITDGCGSGNFCPDSNLTRGEAAVLVIRMRYGSTANFSFPSTPFFTDVTPDTFGWSSIQRMMRDHITNGCAPTLYCPTSTITRAEMAVFIAAGGFNSGLPLNTPVLTSITPPTVPPGQTVNFTINGLNTSFAQDLTTLAPMPGFTVDTICVGDSETIYVSLTSSSDAPPQPVSVVAITGDEEAVLPNGLTVGGPI